MRILIYFFLITMTIIDTISTTTLVRMDYFLNPQLIQSAQVTLMYTVATSIGIGFIVGISKDWRGW